jgi:hypothetical protein
LPQDEATYCEQPEPASAGTAGQQHNTKGHRYWGDSNDTPPSHGSPPRLPRPRRRITAQIAEIAALLERTEALFAFPWDRRMYHVALEFTNATPIRLRTLHLIPMSTALKRFMNVQRFHEPINMWNDRAGKRHFEPVFLPATKNKPTIL